MSGLFALGGHPSGGSLFTFANYLVSFSTPDLP